MDKILKTSGTLQFVCDGASSTATDILSIPYLNIFQEIVWETDTTDIWISRESVEFLKEIECIRAVSYNEYYVNGVIKIDSFVEIDYSKFSFYEERGIRVDYSFIGDSLQKIRNHEDSFKKLSNDFEQLLHDRDFTDVTIQCEGGELKAHRAVLSARSPVFKRMLTNENYLESRENVIKSSLEFNLLSDALLYIYTGRVNKSKAKELLEVADYYDLQQLKAECISIIISEITAKNVISILMLAHSHNVLDLKQEALLFISQCSEKVVHEAELLKLDESESLKPDLVQEILKAVKG
ncbi:hypothetical protein ACFFRR_010636 [Megaselia abdita]